MRTAMPRPRSHSMSTGTMLAAAVEFGFETIPTVLMVGIEEELLVSFGAENGTFHHGDLESELAHGSRYSLASSSVNEGIAHDAAFAHLAPARFKLRFD